MTPQALEKDQPVTFPTNLDSPLRQTGSESRGGAFRGLMFAMLFNVFLIVVAAGIWELWRVITR